VLARQVGVHQHSRQRYALRARIDVLALPFLGRAAAGELQQGLAVKLFLGGKVPIKATARQACFGHDRVDGDIGEPLPVEQLPCALQDSRAGFLLVLRLIRHRRSFFPRSSMCRKKMFLNIFCGWRHSIGKGALFLRQPRQVARECDRGTKGSP